MQPTPEYFEHMTHQYDQQQHLHYLQHRPT